MKIKLVALFAIAFMTACETPTGERIHKEGYRIVEIEKCEYIEVSFAPGWQNGYYSLTHKGNCKNPQHAPK